ncbi:hypothetical protein [uncultured Cellulomonas sp.]|uniref:hypothetical protein n=1 Tax=uncultured Cellulomonas sp. TaxID=189682 RepID=UPI0028EE14ED|nr:hypothetical protein [uncultured Cellulomonas sp.]
MRRAGRGALAATAVLLASGCATAEAGIEPTETAFATIWQVREPGVGLLLLSDLDPDDDRFDAPAVPVRATLATRPDGCLVAVVDGVEHVPVWPVGSQLSGQVPTDEELAADPDAVTMWSISLPDGSVLRVDSPDPAEAFTAQAVVATVREPVDRPPAEAWEQPDVVEPHLAACAVPAPPIAFPDTGSIVTDWERTLARLPADPPPRTPPPGAASGSREPSVPATVEIFVDEHQFTLGYQPDPWEPGEDAPVPLVWGVTATSAQVGTGIATGVVRVTCIALETAPEAVDAAWEDVAELSLRTTEDAPLSAAGGWASGDGIPDRLDAHGAGTYRVRVHARGRDVAYDGVAEVPVEDYLVLAWPAPAAPPATLRATSEVAGWEVGRT